MSSEHNIHTLPYQQSPTPPPLHIFDPQPPSAVLLQQQQQYEGSVSFPEYTTAAHHSPDFNLVASPTIENLAFHAPSPTPSNASVHSVHSVHSHHSFHSGQQSPTHFGPTFSDVQIPTFHGPQRTFAGFVNSAPLTSPRPSAAYALSPTSPFAPNGPAVHGHLPPGFGSGPPHKRLSVSSVSSYGGREGSIEHMEMYGTPEAAQPMLEMSMDNISQSNMQDGSMNMHDTSKRKSREGDEWPPPWSELKTKAGKDRKRLPLACIACRRKKIRCSGQKPACKHCLRSRVPCVYKINTRKATPRTDYMAMLDKRLKRMEDRVIKLIPKDSEAASIPRAIVKPTTAPPGAKSPKKNRKRVADEAFGGEDDIDAWAQTTHDGLGVMPMHKESTDEDTLFLEGAAHLPSKDIQLHLAEIYFEYVYGQSYPLLHKPTFMRNLIAGTVPPVLVLAVCAISARFSQHPQLRIKPAFLRGEEWAEPARRIALKRFDQPNIAILTVYLLLGLHEFGTCHGGRSYMFGGMAQRMGLMLQLHKDRDISDLAGPAGGNSKTGGERNSHTDKEIRRRVMWSCFLMDRFISSGSERPMSIPEICIEIPLPARESLFLMEIEGITETLDGKVLEPEIPESVTKPISNMGTMAYLIRLVSIWGKMVVYFNLGGREAEKVPVWASTSRFIELQKTLQTFSFPPCLVWNSDNLETHRASKRANQFIFMHIVFQHMRLFCHRFALPGSGIVLPKDAPQSFTTEAARTAIEAANQVSNLVKEAVTSNVTAPFAGYAAFYASTVHVQGLFAKSQSTINRAKENLAINVRYLDQMKSWWGMFHFVQQDLKRLFKSHADTRLAQKAAGLDVTDDRKSQPIAKKNAAIFQYGDWMDKYPNGVSKMDYEDPARQSTDEDPANPNRGVLGAHEKELFSVDEFFDKLNKGELKPRPARQSSSSKRPRSTGPVELSRLSDDLTNTLDDNTAAPFQPSYLPNGRPLAIQTALPRSNMLASPSTAMSDLSAWPFDFMPDASQAPRAAAQANMLGLTGLPGSGSGQGMGMGMGMDLSWYMPWNLQPPMNTLGEGMAFEAASAGAQASGLGFGEFESWIGMGLDGIAGGENGKRVER